jgi:hypothetical protein
VRQARSRRAKTKCGADAGSPNGSAIRATEDKAARRFAAAWTEPGSTERTQAILRQIEVALAGKTDSVNGALRNTFEAVPDAPVTSFHLKLFGGKRGLIEMSSGFCRHPHASVKLDGQNGKVFDTNPVVASSCSKKRRGAHKGGVPN